MTRVLAIIKVVVSVGLLILLFRFINVGDLVERYRDIRWGWLVLGLALLQSQGLISTFKWSIILRADQEGQRFLFLWKTHLISVFLSLFLPSSIGGDVYRVWALNQKGSKLSKSTASVLFDRVTGVLALMTVGLVGASLMLERSYVAVIAGIYTCTLLGLILLTSDSIVHRLPQPTSKYVGFPLRILRSFNHYRRSPGKLLAAMGLAFLYQANIVVIVFCYARALQIPASAVSFAEMLAVVPVIYLTEMLPISINGIGVRDSAFAFFFQRVGGTAEQGLAVSLLIIAVRYVKGLPGGVLLLVSLLKRRRQGGDSSPVPHSESTLAAPRPEV